MDINQSSYSRFKANKSNISQPASSSKASSDAMRTRDTAGISSPTMNLSDLKEGQVVKGQIIDHRFNEVQLQLEPGKQIVTAKLSGDVPLSIGQNASFQVVKGSTDQLILKYIPNSTTTTADSTILKALSASNIAATSVNKAIVAELLNHRMPVDKQTLQTLIKLSYLNREASPLTLVIMLKNNLPLTPENIKQFEAYQNSTNKLLGDINTITKNISELLKQELTAEGELIAKEPSDMTNPSKEQLSPAKAYNTIAAQGGECPTAPLLKDNLNQAIRINGTLIELLYNNAGQLPEEAIRNIPSNLLSSEELSILSKAIEQKVAESSSLSTNSASDTVQKLLQGTLPAEEAFRLLNSGTMQEDTAVASILSKLQNNLNPSGETHTVLSEVLNPAERASLLEYIKTFPDSSSIKAMIEDGSADLTKLLKYVQNNLEASDGKAAISLLKAPEYHKLLENAFLHKWTLTPEKIALKTPVKELYQNLKEDMESLGQLVKISHKDAEALSLGDALKNVKESITFMKDLNELFTYLQLPVLYQDKQLHSELYVYTDKKTLKEKKGPVSVLLHLDMSNLGALNIHLQLNLKTLQAKFYAEDKDAGQIIQKNIPLLEAALQKKGYSLQAELMESLQKPDFIKDFLEQNTLDNTLKHYTFDIRT